jgi:hypothetical protein
VAPLLVQMNMTATVMWSLIWSVYEDGGPCEHSGMMYAQHPWGGNYSIKAPVWVTAHTTQFVSPNWRYLPGGSGLLKGGGSFVTLASPDGQHVSVVIEKLEGRCQYCGAPQPTCTETVTLCMDHFINVSALPATAGALRLVQWHTNKSAWFRQRADIIMVRGADATCEYSATLVIEKDSITTVSTVVNATHGAFDASDTDTAFPLPYSDGFEARQLGSFGRFLADNGGSFELAPNPTLWGSAQVLQQVVTVLAVHNAWTKNVQPITMIGDANWSTIETTVEVLLPAQYGAYYPAAAATAAAATPYVGVCQRVTGGGGQISNTADQALCLCIFANGSWVLGSGRWAGPPKIPPLAAGRLARNLDSSSGWHELGLSEPTADQVRATIDGETVAELHVNASSACGLGGVCIGKGRVALVSGFHTAFFDNLTIQTAR